MLHLKAFLEMGLDTQRILSLREDLKQLIVGEEEEAREKQTLDLEIPIESWRVRDTERVCVRQRESVCVCERECVCV